ncbi:hypothetical protein LPB136_08625 [Tenacibaculum todarodis]|uniref:Lipoprotein n=1 Tax=Tenacibaculum todarodis TaxID=1850252 RepID=A0A1L3JJZ1_9FLAO|nr:hypothetical protein [Tenacibaculum todarodis]APG65414.1 hypothetical protein LPB136_08625 [Tenacibaculum todarodis]
MKLIIHIYLKKIKVILFVIAIASLTSCASFKKSKLSENQTYLTDENLNLLNGTYKNNMYKGPALSEYFWGSRINMKEFQSIYELISEKKVPYFITLKVLDKNSLRVEIKVDERILKSNVIKGKVRNGYFEQNRKMGAVPVILFNTIYSSKFRIGYLKDNNLITDFKKIEFGTYYFLIPFSDNKEINNLIHKKVDE